MLPPSLGSVISKKIGLFSRVFVDAKFRFVTLKPVATVFILFVL
jgi:hypothetical protein